MARHEFWTDRLSEHLDGSLPDDQAAAVEEHLAECADCRRVASELTEVRRRARALGGTAPSRDLWPEIRARLGENEGVVDLTERLAAAPMARTAGDAPERRAGRGLRTLGRAAAVVALMAAAGAAGWALRGSDPAGAAGALAADATVEGAPLSAEFAGSQETFAAGGLAREAAELERLLAEAPEGVPAETVELLRKNLQVIRAAIAESRAALEIDPDNVYVQEHLQGAVARQRAFLRQASSILSAAD